jgi:hypothetical protein
VKTEGRDALWMLNALDRFCARNKKALGRNGAARTRACASRWRAIGK